MKKPGTYDLLRRMVTAELFYSSAPLTVCAANLKFIRPQGFFAVDPGCYRRALALSGQFHDRDTFPWEFTGRALTSIWTHTAVVEFTMLIKVTP